MSSVKVNETYRAAGYPQSDEEVRERVILAANVFLDWCHNRGHRTIPSVTIFRDGSGYIGITNCKLVRLSPKRRVVDEVFIQLESLEAQEEDQDLARQ